MPLDDRHCPLERVKQSEHSPDKVDSRERLGRLIYHEEQLDPATGALAPGAFQMAEFIDPRRRGASVARLDHSNAVELRSFAERLGAGRDEYWVRGAGIGYAYDARQICDTDGHRVFCVIDDGEPDFRPHALITRSEAYSGPELTPQRLRSKLKPFRQRLIDLFSPVTPIENIYG